MSGASFTGRARRRQTTWKVRAIDRVARFLITIGGLGTILAVSLVCLFLVWVVVPLFLPAEVRPAGATAVERLAGETAVVALQIDEYRVLGWTCLADGTVEAFRLDDGSVLEAVRPFGEARPTCWAFPPGVEMAAFGFADGTVRLARIRFATTFLDPEEAGRELRALEVGETAVHEGGMVERTVEGQLRRQGLSVEVEDPLVLAPGAALLRLDLAVRGDSPILLSVAGDGVLRLKEVRRRPNLMTGKVVSKVSGGEVPLPEFGSRGAPDHLVLAGVGTLGFAVWEDGHLLRFDTRQVEAPVLAETLSLVEPGRTVTALRFLLGKTSLLVGDSAGDLGVWFPVKPEGESTVDGATLVRGHRLPGTGAPVTALAASERTRMTLAGYGNGAVRVFHVTSEKLLGEVPVPGGAAPAVVAFTPKDDGIVAAAGVRLHRWDLDAPHPETTAAALFTPVWYEGSVRPRHVWQSSSGTDDFEPKFGFLPLIFGTLKATLYSMIFAVPIALLAAVYSSEFLHPKTRARVKPTLELMASLPSVVLGFLAALVFAPFLEDWVPEALAGFVSVPLALLLGAHLWQMVPPSTAARRVRLRLPLMGVALFLGAGGALLLGPLFERTLFAGDVKAWLDGQTGTGTGAWMFLLLPGCGVAAALLNARVLGPRLAPVVARWPRAKQARANLAKFAALSAAAVVAALGISSALDALGFDPRGTCVATYVQRNALVVGFVMGFAVIPIIYTLAEDALSAVPEHLRAASLAVGATRWQTAVSVIVPTATSGLFSAVMIGLGRAVGETMIVLMAAGNTPVMDWNVFNGFRTLSANIAVELPEAVRNGTNYRLLFLAALVLFALTFALNTVAEVVRLRFRRRAFQL